MKQYSRDWPEKTPTRPAAAFHQDLVGSPNPAQTLRETTPTALAPVSGPPLLAGKARRPQMLPGTFEQIDCDRSRSLHSRCLE